MKSFLPPFPVYERIKLLRVFSGLSQVEMAKLLRGSQAWLSKVESGKLEISAQHLFLLRAIFGISSDAILDGAIPYYQISLRMNSEALLPPAYIDQPTLSINSIYPVLSALSTGKNKTLWPSICRQLKIKSFVFCDSEIRVNELFLRMILENSKMRDYFAKSAHFEDLKASIEASWSGSGRFPLANQVTYSDSFLAEWMKWMPHSSFNRPGITSDLGLTLGSDPQFRSMSSQVG